MKRNCRTKDMLAGAVIMALLGGLIAPNAMAALATKTIQVFTGVSIYVDDKKLNPQDANGNPAEAFVYNGTTYLPVRAVGEAMGKTVQWEGSTSSVYLGKHTSDQPAVWLLDLDYFSGSALRHNAVPGKDNLGETYQNVISPGLGAIDNTYKLNGQYSKIAGTLYQDYQERSNTQESTLKIYGDGKLLFNASMAAGVNPVEFSVDLSGVLEMRVYFSSGSIYSSSGGCLGDCGLWT